MRWVQVNTQVPDERCQTGGATYPQPRRTSSRGIPHCFLSGVDRSIDGSGAVREDLRCTLDPARRDVDGLGGAPEACSLGLALPCLGLEHGLAAHSHHSSTRARVDACARTRVYAEVESSSVTGGFRHVQSRQRQSWLGDHRCVFPTRLEPDGFSAARVHAGFDRDHVADRSVTMVHNCADTPACGATTPPPACSTGSGMPRVGMTMKRLAWVAGTPNQRQSTGRFTVDPRRLDDSH